MEDRMVELIERRQTELIEQLAEEVEGEVYNAYSGRFMYGKQCLGVTVPDLKKALMAVGRLGLPEPRIDQIGLEYILYWPEVPSTARR